MTQPAQARPHVRPIEVVMAVERIRDTAYVVQNRQSRHVGVLFGDEAGSQPSLPNDWSLLGVLPPLYPEWLGDRSFAETHGIRFPYVAGEMANGIATPEMVQAVGQCGMLGFLGCAGLSLNRIQQLVTKVKAGLSGTNAAWGANLIHTPSEPRLEDQTVDLFLAEGVRRVSTSAFMKLESSVVRYACQGLTRDAQGRVQRPNKIFAKVSRPEVAAAFLRPPPSEMLRSLVQAGRVTEAEAQLAAQIPVAEDITAEADSGGHTDNRPLGALLSSLMRLRDDIVRELRYTNPVRIGAAGGLGTPSAVASAFALGAAYVLTGSVNQSANEAGISLDARRMLAGAGLADVTMAPAADMFEMGVRVQVLKRGTLFAARGARLFDVYRDYDSWDTVPAAVQKEIETQMFRQPFDAVWKETREFWQGREPREAERADRDPHHRMALAFRWYLGKASRWAIEGAPGRAIDFQVWCGPAMGAFNDWVRGSFLEPVENRGVVQIGLNLMEGAAVITRAQQLRSFGVAVPAEAFSFRPRPFDVTGTL